MVAALTYVGVSVAVLLLLTFVYVVEDMKGKRIFLARARSWFDILLLGFIAKLSVVISFFTHGFMRILLHYGAHTVLKRVLNTLRNLEKRVEDLVRHNRKVVKDISAAKTRTHLDAIAEHKEEVALSEKQKEQMRSH
jgi:membrane protein implicated in regulation of membrane protease activity